MMWYAEEHAGIAVITGDGSSLLRHRRRSLPCRPIEEHLT